MKVNQRNFIKMLRR